MSETIYTLVPSTNRGRYALQDMEGSHDLTTGERIAVWLGGQWIQGRVDHSTRRDAPGWYHLADAGTHAQGALAEMRHDPIGGSTRQPHGLYCGYYFKAEDGAVCGLCTGMKVRLV